LALVEKEVLFALFKNKLLLLTIAIVVITLVLAILFSSIFFPVLGIGLPAACIVGIILFLSWTPPMVLPKPAKVAIKAEPKELIADGKSKSFVTIQLLDKEGNTIAAPKDTEVKLTTTGGQLESALVKIPKGAEKAETVLISSREKGIIDLAADARGLDSIDIKLNFKEKPRYCMHCGSPMSLKAKVCENCGKSPPAGVDTKVCHNCKSVIPVVAKYCSECGTGQKT
jgi:RNA polymerase subunit RPABC4/transcription elongation factor Spt4